MDDVVEVGVGVLLLDLLQEPPKRGEPCDVGLFGRARAPGEHSEDLALPSEDNRARITGVGELAVPLTVEHDGGLERVLLDDAVVRVVALDGLEAIGAAKSSVGSAAVLDHDQAPLTVGVEVRGVADFSCRDDAAGLEEAVIEDSVGGPIFVVRVHQLGKVAGGGLAACGGKKGAVSERSPCDRKRGDGAERRKRRTEKYFVSQKSLINHLGV